MTVSLVVVFYIFRSSILNSNIVMISHIELPAPKGAGFLLLRSLRPEASYTISASVNSRNSRGTVIVMVLSDGDASRLD